jgi:hypothetical protein
MVDFGVPSFFTQNLLYYSYVEILYVPTKKYEFFSHQNGLSN